jgi:hypothetical protein
MSDFWCENCPMADPADCMLASYCPHRDGPRPEGESKYAGRSRATGRRVLKPAMGQNGNAQKDGA